MNQARKNILGLVAVLATLGSLYAIAAPSVPGGFSSTNQFKEVVTVRAGAPDQIEYFGTTGFDAIFVPAAGFAEIDEPLVANSLPGWTLSVSGGLVLAEVEDGAAQRRGINYWPDVRDAGNGPMASFEVELEAGNWSLWTDAGSKPGSKFYVGINREFSFSGVSNNCDYKGWNVDPEIETKDCTGALPAGLTVSEKGVYKLDVSASSTGVELRGIWLFRSDSPTSCAPEADGNLGCTLHMDRITHIPPSELEASSGNASPKDLG